MEDYKQIITPAEEQAMIEAMIGIESTVPGTPPRTPNTRPMQPVAKRSKIVEVPSSTTSSLVNYADSANITVSELQSKQLAMKVPASLADLNKYVPAVAKVFAGERSIENLSNALMAPNVPPEILSSRPGPGGKSFLYMPTNVLYMLLSSIYGPLGWKKEVLFPPAIVFQGQVGSKQQFQVVVTVTVRLVITQLAIGGDPRHELAHYDGTGVGDSTQANVAQAYNTAIKTAESDALKRAGRCHNLTGNILYNPKYLKEAGRVRHKRF